jgi:hypothetical protein
MFHDVPLGDSSLGDASLGDSSFGDSSLGDSPLGGVSASIGICSSGRAILSNDFVITRYLLTKRFFFGFLAVPLPSLNRRRPPLQKEKENSSALDCTGVHVYTKYTISQKYLLCALFLLFILS